ncbi:MAG: hypothetical protein ACREXI_07220 [Caldimonas sp.]
MYDHNQTLVPDSFLDLHSVHGRPLLTREATEARYELCEDTAAHAAAFLGAHVQDPHDAGAALKRCHDGLRAEPSAFSPAEAEWVIRRVAELQEWPQPGWLDEDLTPSAAP